MFLPDETENPEIAFLHELCILFYPQTQNTLKYHLVTAEPPFTPFIPCQNDRLYVRDGT